MELLILGATGNTGKELVKQSLAQGHRVTVLLRNPEKLDIKDDNLVLVKGDVLNKEDVDMALEGKDALVSGLGVGNTLTANDLMYNAVSTLIPAMQIENVKRFIWLSAFGVGPTFKQANWLQKLAFKLPLRDIYADKEKADELVRNSDLDWTIVAPVKLTNGSLTTKYEAGEKFEMFGFPAISRADVAHFMLSQLNDESFIKKTVILK